MLELQPLLQVGESEETEETVLQVPVTAATATATAPTPPPIPRRSPATRKPADDTQNSGRIVMNPTGLFAVDIAAELSAAISMRMKPPPEPPTDLRLSTGAWIVATAIAFTAWIAGVLYEPACFPYVALMGGALIAFGFLWRAYLDGSAGNFSKLLVYLVPPVGLIKLFQRTETNGYRPLHFTLTGLVIVGLYILGPAAFALTQNAMGSTSVLPEGNPTETLAGKLKKQHQFKKYDQLLQTLKDLTAPESANLVENRAEVIEQLVQLTTSLRSDIRAAALAALLTWSSEDARPILIAWIQSLDATDRRAALALAPRCIHPEVAPFLAARVADRDDRRAMIPLLQKYGPTCEEAVLSYLTHRDDLVVLACCEILGRVGGEKSATALERLQVNTDSDVIRAEARRSVSEIAARNFREKSRTP